MLVGSGVVAAQNGTPQTKTFVGPNAPVISADSPPARNPAINPSAAGLSQGGTAAPNPSKGAIPGNNPGEVGQRELGQGKVGTGEFTAAQARQSLRYYSYTNIVDLHLNQNRQWQAQATHNGRRVKVVLDDRGTATEQK